MTSTSAVTKKARSASDIEKAKQLRSWTRKFNAKIKAEFAGEHLGSIQNLLNLFSVDGKASAANLFHYARKASRLKEAIEAVKSRYEKHWVYMAPEVRGVGNEQWRRTHEACGVPVPQ